MLLVAFYAGGVVPVNLIFVFPPISPGSFAGVSSSDVGVTLVDGNDGNDQIKKKSFPPFARPFLLRSEGIRKIHTHAILHIHLLCRFVDCLSMISYT